MRQLTEQEIDFILKDVPSFFPNYLTPEIKNSYIGTMMKDLKLLLEKEKVHNDFKDVSQIKTEIEKHVNQSLIQPGEGVGVICAQSIGERQTQLCCGYDEEILIYVHHKKVFEKMGKFIDSYFSTFYHSVKKLPNGSEILQVAYDFDLNLPMVTENGKSQLVPLIEMSRHLPHGDLLKVTSKTGRSVLTTLSHSHLRLDENNKIVPVKACELKIGDCIPVLQTRKWGVFDWFQESKTFIPSNPKILTEDRIEYENIDDINQLALFLNFYGIISEITSSSSLVVQGKEQIKKFLSKNMDYTGPDIFWDPIIELSIIKEKDYPHKYVYDFSVEGNQTFMMKNGIFVHNTLNSFHSSGLCVATVVTGVPRFLELLNATKDPKMSSNTFCIRQNVKTPEEVRSLIECSLINFCLNDLVISEKIFLEEKEEEFWFAAHETIYSNQFRDYKSGISFVLDVEKIYKYKILLTKIKNKIETTYADICCVISPMYIGQLDIFVDSSSIQIPNDESLPLFLKNRNYIEIYLEEVVKPKLLELEVCGIKNIKNFHYSLENERWKIQTEGSNFTEILCLPYVDISTVSSNNMWEIYNTMGIEATREFLIEEFTNVVSSDGTFINPSHILLLVDVMTYQGNITSVSRYGMKKEQMGVLSRASFEESLDQFCNAGFYAEKDFIKSVSANIMCGKRSSIGSGLCNLKMDWKTIKNK